MFICCICTWTNSLWVFAAALLLRNATKGFTGRTHHQRWLHHKREASSSSGWWLLWLVDTLTGFVVLILTYAFSRANTTIKQKREDTKTYEVTVCHGDILTCQKAYSHMMLNHPYRYQQNLARELSQNLAISYPRDVLFHGNRIIRRHVRRQHQDQGDWEQTHQGLRDDAMGQVFKVSPNDAPHLGQDDTPILSTIPSLARVWSEMWHQVLSERSFFCLPFRQIWEETPPGRCSLRGCASGGCRDLGHFDCFGLLPFFNVALFDVVIMLRLRKKSAEIEKNGTLTCQVYKGTFGHIAAGGKLLQKSPFSWGSSRAGEIFTVAVRRKPGCFFSLSLKDGKWLIGRKRGYIRYVLPACFTKLCKYQFVVKGRAQKPVQSCAKSSVLLTHIYTTNIANTSATHGVGTRKSKVWQIFNKECIITSFFALPISMISKTCQIL